MNSQSYSQLKFITEVQQEYTARSGSEKCKWSLEGSMFKLLNLSTSSGGSHRMLSSPSSEKAATFVRCFWSQEAHLKLSVRGFAWGLITYARSAQQLSRFQSPKMKAGVQNKPPCLCNSLGYGKPIFSGVGTILRAKFPVISQGPILQDGPSKDSCLRPVC